MKAFLRKNGLYEAKGVHPDTGRQRSFYGRTPEEAIRKAKASYATTVDNTAQAFYSSVYIPTVARRSDAWIEQIRWAWDGHIRPEFGARDIGSISRKEVQAFFNRLGDPARAKPLKATSIQKIRIVFSGIMALAKRDEVISYNPCEDIRLPTPQPPTKTALSPAELRKLLNASHPRVRPFILLTGFCGLRAGEALGVTRHAIKGGVLSVEQQVLQPKGGCIISDRLKTAQSRRDIPLPAALEKMLLNCGQVSAVFVCSDENGKYLTPNNAHRELEIAIERAKVRRVTPHELRHTFITILLVDLGAPSGVVAALAGKAESGTLAAYSHASPAARRSAMEQLWDVVQMASEIGEKEA